MALTLGSSVATQGTDFSTTVSGFTAGSRRSLANNANGVFHLADLNDTQMTLTASGSDLNELTAPAAALLAIDETPQTIGSPTTRTQLTVSIARAGAVTPASITVAPSAAVSPGGAVTQNAPTVNGLTAPLTYALVDAAGGNRRALPAGLTLASDGSISGTLTSRIGAYGLALRGTDANKKIVYSNAFSIDVYAPITYSVGGVGLTLSGPLTFSAGAASGTLVANIGNVPSGVTPTLTPNDGRLAIAGDATNGWKVVVGLTASTAGTIGLTVAAQGAASASAMVTISAVVPTPVRAFGAATATKDGSVGQTYSAPAGMTGVQWYQEAITSDRTQTAITGAAGSTYASVQADSGKRLVARGTLNGVLTDAVALQVVLDAPILLASFDSLTGAVAANGGSLSLDTANKVQGAASMVLTSDGSAQSTLTIADLGVQSPSTWGVVAHYSDVGGDPELAQFYGATGALRIGQGNSYLSTNAITDGSGGGLSSDYRLNGYWDSQNVSTLGGLASLAANTTTGLRIYGPLTGSPQNNSIRFDCLVAKAGGMPTVVLGLDDGRPGQYNYAKGIYEARGFRCTLYLPTALIDQTQRLTTAQVMEMYAAGHDMQLDGTADDNIITTEFTAQAAWVQDLQNQKAWFAAKGLPVPKHLCYPNGIGRLAGTRVALSGVSLVSGAAQITVSSTTGITQGMKVTGYGFPTTGTFSRVQSVDSATQLTVTIAPTATVTRLVTFTDDSLPFHTGKLQQLMLANGIYSARSTFASGTYKSSRFTRFGEAGGALYHAAQGVTGYTASQMLASVDEAILHGRTVEYYMHDVQTGGNADGTSTNPSINVYAENLTIFADYLKAKVDAGQLVVLTKAQQWARDSGSAVPV